jgi:hypothetical protein
MHTFATRTRLAVLAAGLAATAGCSNGSGASLPFANLPNNGGGTSGTLQAGGTSTALLRFVQGSPDAGSIDVCIDNVPFNTTLPSVAYGTASSKLFAVAGGIAHTVAVYTSLSAQLGPYFGQAPLATTTIAPAAGANAARETIVLAGTAASHTFGLYVFGEPSLTPAPAANAVFSFNAAPRFSSASPSGGVGFGYTPASGTATTLPGASNVAAPVAAAVTSATVNAAVQSTIPSVPASFYAGTGVANGTVTPSATAPAPAQTATPYVVALYAIDTAAGGLQLVAVPEEAVGAGL